MVLNFSNGPASFLHILVIKVDGCSQHLQQDRRLSLVSAETLPHSSQHACTQNDAGRYGVFKDQFVFLMKKWT